MSSRWPTVPMRSEVKMLSGGTPSKSEPNFWNGNIPWVGSGEMTQRRIRDTELHVTELGAENGARLIPENTVLVVVRGMSLAKEFRISLTARAVTFNQDLKALKPSPKIDPVFLFYYLQSQRHAIRDSATDASHGTKKIESRVLEEWPLPVVEKVEQQRIASILSAYDDLIENSRRRIELLERSLRLLYREWFVHFRFPGHEHVKIRDALPEGWKRTPIASLCTVGRGGSPRPIREFLGGSVPWFKIGDATASGSPFVFSTAEKITEGGVKNSVLLNPGELILSNSATCGIPFFTGVAGCIHDGWLHFQRLQRVSKWFLYCALLEKQREILAGIGEGATQKNLNTDYVGRQFLLLPQDEALLRAFDEIAKDMFRQIMVLTQLNLRAACTRDLLLPRLMNGEIWA